MNGHPAPFSANKSEKEMPFPGVLVNAILLHEDGIQNFLVKPQAYFDIPQTSVRSIKALPVILFARNASLR